MQKPKQITARQQKARGSWAAQLLDDVLANNPHPKELNYSSRALGELLGLSHTAALNWVRGLSVPTPAQTLKLANMAGRDPIAELLIAESLRTTDKHVKSAYDQAYTAWVKRS